MFCVVCQGVEVCTCTPWCLPCIQRCTSDTGRFTSGVMDGELARPVVHPLLKGITPGGPKTYARWHRSAEQRKLRIQVRAHKSLQPCSISGASGIIAIRTAHCCPLEELTARWKITSQDCCIPVCLLAKLGRGSCFRLVLHLHSHNG